MASVQAFTFYFAFWVILNLLLGAYAVSSTDYEGIDLPHLADEPGLLNYFELIGGYFVLFFDVMLTTLSNVPVWLTALLVIINAGGAFVVLQMIRGN